MPSRDSTEPEGSAGRGVDRPVWTEPQRHTPVLADVDVLVAGGGPAGVCAAVGAARAGARVMLVEANGFLGGMWTAGMVLTLAGYNSWLQPYGRAVRGIAGEWLARAAQLGGAEDNESFVVSTDPETMKLVADELVLAEGVELLLHSWVADVLMEGTTVRGAIIENVEGRQAVRAGVTIDCTGNGDLIARSGAPFVKRQELQPMTVTFRMSYDGRDADQLQRPKVIPIGPEATVLREPLLSQASSRREPPGLDRDDMRRRHAEGELPRFGGPWFGGIEPDVMWINATRLIGDASVVTDLTNAEVQGRRDVQALVNYFREHVPGFEQTRLLHVATSVGVRETRRMVGRYVLTGEDIRSRASFDDTIAVGCWPIDVHPTDGHVGAHEMFVPLPYGIPYRTLLPQQVDNLLVAGRCISTTREALGSTRVGATCAALGHAAGVAAALAAGSGIAPAEQNVGRVQQELEKQGAVIDPNTI